jgi:hypothetical protein
MVKLISSQFNPHIIFLGEGETLNLNTQPMNFGHWIPCLTNVFVFCPQDDSLQVSFHLPLHRYLAVFMCQAIKHQGLSLKDVLPPKDVLKLIMMHPLRVQVGPTTSCVFQQGSRCIVICLPQGWVLCVKLRVWSILLVFWQECFL